METIAMVTAAALELAPMTDSHTTREAIRLAEVEYVSRYPGTYNITPQVCAEVTQLIEAGVDVELVDPHDPAAFDLTTQIEFDQHIAALEANPEEGAQIFRQTAANQAWDRLRMRALALHPLYNAGRSWRLGQGIPSEAFDRPLFSVPEAEGNLVSAADIVRSQRKPEKAEQIIAEHRTFVETPIDPVSEAYYRGSLDGRSIRTRGIEAMRRAANHFTNPDGTISRKDLRSASVACGAVGPFTELAKEVEARGGTFEKAILIDKDPMALAAAKSLTEVLNLDDSKVDLELRDLLREPLSSYIEKGSVDIADLLGLVEYLPKEFAVGLLQQVKEIMRPGGVIIWGNMLADRGQQTMFKDIVKWPRLNQRTISECLEIMQEAGFSLDDISVSIPAREGVYAVYEIRIPESPSDLHVKGPAVGHTALSQTALPQAA